MRGHLDNLEQCLNSMLTELKYHTSQVQITTAEKDSAGALLAMNVMGARNQILNEEAKFKQESSRNRKQVLNEYEKLTRHTEAIQLDSNTQTSRLWALQRRITGAEIALGINNEPWNNKVCTI